MPKKVDHAARRLELAEALWRVTREHGWEAVSLRSVAAEAGVSMGMVQHYFTTKDEMLRFALEMIAEDTVRRIRERIADLPEPHTPRLLVRTALTEMIPRPSRRSTEAEAAAVFLRRFTLSPAGAAKLAASVPDLKASLTELIRAARNCSEADARRDAGGLVALLDGLIMAIATGDLTSATAVEILDRQLDFVFG